MHRRARRGVVGEGHQGTGGDRRRAAARAPQLARCSVHQPRRRAVRGLLPGLVPRRAQGLTRPARHHGTDARAPASPPPLGAARGDPDLGGTAADRGARPAGAGIHHWSVAAPGHGDVTTEFHDLTVASAGPAPASCTAMDQAVAYSALAATVGLAVTRPRLGSY